MLKVLAIVAVILTVAQIPVPVPRQTADAGTDNRQSHKNNPNNKQPRPTATTSSQSVSAPPSASESNPGHEKDGQQSVRVSEFPTVSVGHDWLDYLSIAFSGALVLIGYFGVRYAKRTLADIKRQADAMEERARDAREAAAKAIEIAKHSADAALLNAQAVRNAQRAWVLVAPEYNIERPHFIKLVARNYGHSPAEVLWYIGQTPIREFGEEFPAKPPYERRPSEFAHHRWIPPGEPMDESICLVNFKGDPFLSDPALLQQINSGERVQWAYGVIYYRDIFSEGEHETRFCFSFFRMLPKGVMDGPPGYNTAT